MIRKIIQLAILMVVLLLSSEAFATIYYIDYNNGLDTNNGTSKETPWKRAPGMFGCSGNCLVYQTQHSSATATGGAGNQFILKGGVTWPREALSWDWVYGSGTEANPIYFGVDQTWYIGDSWSRPILDTESLPPNLSAQGIGSMVRVYGFWLVVDNIEFKGVAQTSDSAPAMLVFGTSSPSGGEIKNCYFHGWSHGGTATHDDVIIVISSLFSEGACIDLKIHNNVWDGSDTTKDMAMAYKGSAGHFYNNYIAHMANGHVGNVKYVWGNTFKDIAAIPSFDPTAHSNAIENTGGQSIYYNNYISGSSGGATIFTTSSDGYIDYVFNNVIISDKNQSIQIDNNGLSTGLGAGIYVFNNTLQAPTDINAQLIAGPVRTDYPELPFMTVRNNHIIANYPTVNFQTMVTTKVESNTKGMTNAEAISANYLSISTYPYFPPSGGATVDTGYNLTSFCSSIPSSSPSLASTACLSDTTLGVSYNATDHTVSYPNKPAVIRTNWDIGAYDYEYSDVTAPTIDTLSVSESIVYLNKFIVSWTCSDAVGITGQKWRADAVPNASNGTALSTSPETINGVLVSGDNDIYVGCYDAAGNYGTALIPALKYVPSTFYGVSLN